MLGILAAGMRNDRLLLGIVVWKDSIIDACMATNSADIWSKLEKL